MSLTQTVTRTEAPGVPGAPGAPGPPDGPPAGLAQPDPNNVKDYSKRPNAPPSTEEAVPSAQWARWRLYKVRPDIQDNFPEYFPDVRRQLHDKLTTQIQVAAQQAPKPPKFTERSMRELTKDGYEPTQLGFAPLIDFYDEDDLQNSKRSRRQRLDSGEEGERIPSLWFERMSQDLFARVWEFCSETFGVETIGEKDLVKKHKERDWTIQWLSKLPHEFVVLASQVARGDMTVVEPKSYDPNNWEFLFLDKMSRVKLMVGIMAKLLEKNVFNSLMVGANDAEKTALTGDDQARDFLDNSYQRNRTRSQTVRNYIQSKRPALGIGLTDLFTDNFWDEVESVTMGILDLLLPLINLLGDEMRDFAWPPLTQVHQRLHDIVAEAAWFTNGMRATRSVFWIQFPLPGELNDISHEHAIDDIWNRSKPKALKYDKEKLVEWEAGREATTEAQRAEYEAEKPRPFVRRTAKVQIAMWPFIKRYTAVGERDAGDGAYNTGEIITQIIKAQTVYYYGDDSDEADMKERLTLSEHIKRHRWAKWTTTKAIVSYILICALFIVLTTAPDFQQALDHQPLDIISSSHSQEFVKGSKTTTVVAVPVRTEVVTNTVVVESLDDEEKPSKPQHKSQGPSVTRITETITETIVRKSHGGQDNNAGDDEDDGNNIDIDSEKNDDDSGDGDDEDDGNNIDISSDKNDDDSGDGDGDSGDDDDDDSGGDDDDSSTSTGEKIAANLASAKDKATASFASAADRAGASIASVKDDIAADVVSGADKVAASFSSGVDRASASVASVKDDAAARIASMKDEAAERIASAENEAAAIVSSAEDEAAAKVESMKKESLADRKNMKKSVTSRSSVSEQRAKRGRSSSSESKSSSRNPIRESSTSKILSSGETRATKKRSKSSRGSTASERSTAVESSTSSESNAEAARAAARIAAEDVDIETTTVYKDEDGTISVQDVTTSKVAVPSKKKKMETTTITVPADKVVITVTGTPTPTGTKGTLKKLYHHGTRPPSF